MRRPLAFAVLAGIAAVLAAIIVFSALKRREAEVQKALANTVDIVVADRDLPLGTRIDSSAVKLARWSRDSVPFGAFTDSQALLNSFVKIEIVANEPIVASKLFSPEKASGVMPLLIPNGMRAMAVQVDEVSDIAGFVQPRAHVDVLVSVSGSGRNIPSFSRTVLQDIEVLAVAQQIEKKNDQPQVVKVVTLLVTPQQAETLALASHEGQLRLAMRNFEDNKIVATSGVDMRDLHGYSAPAINSQSATPREHAIGPALMRELKVMVLRDGKSEESVSFVKSSLSRGSFSADNFADHDIAPAQPRSPAPPSAASALAPLTSEPVATVFRGNTSESDPPQDATGYVAAPKTVAIP